jgi:hypothetical protein
VYHTYANGSAVDAGCCVKGVVGFNVEYPAFIAFETDFLLMHLHCMEMRNFTSFIADLFL